MNDPPLEPTSHFFRPVGTVALIAAINSAGIGVSTVIGLRSSVLVLDVFQERGGAAILKVSGIGVGQADGDRVGAAQRQRVDP